MTILPYTLLSAIVGITKNEHAETTYSKSMERIDCFIVFNCCLDICGHMPGQMLDLKDLLGS